MSLPLRLLMLLAAALGLTFYFLIMPFEKVGRPLVVATGRLACGEVLLTQTFTGTSDPYLVLFYFRPNGARDWAEFYVDDESPYWRGTMHISPSGDLSSVTLYGTQELSFRCGTRTLGRRGQKPAPSRAIVQDPLARDYRQRVDPRSIHLQLEAYWAGQ